MTQQTLTTKPVGDSAETAAEPTPRTGELASKPRRRLGSWQASSFDGATAAIGEASTDGGATLPLGASQGESAATVDLGPADAAQLTAALPGQSTGPIADPKATVVLPKADATAPIRDANATVQLPGGAAQSAPLAVANEVEAATVPLAPAAATAPMAATASTAELLKTIRLKGADAEPTDSTRPIRTQTARMTAGLASGAATAPIDSGAGDSTADLSATASLEDEQQLATLRERTASNPDDSDALFQLAVILHRLGRRREAREALTKLVALYQERGQHAQAKRIMGMLSAPKTGPIATEDLTPRPAGSATATSQLPGRTAQLPAMHTAQLARTARMQAKLLTPPPAPEFVPETLSFTIPLPGEQRLPLEVRELVLQASDDLKDGKLQAAYELCLYALDLAPEYVPLHLRDAEIYSAQRLRRRARTQAETLLRLVGKRHLG